MDYPLRFPECPKCGMNLADIWPMLPVVQFLPKTAGHEVYRNTFSGEAVGRPVLQKRAIGNLSSGMFEPGSPRMNQQAPREVEEIVCQCRCGFQWFEVPLDQRKEAP